MLTYEEFMKLSEEERRKRYIELSSHDKFRVRTSTPLKPISIGEARELTEEQIEKVKKWKKEYERKYGVKFKDWSV